MIFPPRIADLVLAGRVSQTRRPLVADRDCSVAKDRIYAVQKDRGRPGVGHVRVLSVRTGDLSQVTVKDALAMGYRSLDAFFEDWALHHADRAMCAWPQPVWVIAFEPVPVLPAQDPMWLSRSLRGITPRRSASIDREVPAEDLSQGGHLLEVAGGDRRGGSRPVSRVDPKAVSLTMQLEDRLDRLVSRARGEDAEDAARLFPELGSAGEVRKRRRRLGLRAVDGLPPLSPQLAEQTKTFMLTRPDGCSVRELARAMDWSPGKAHQVISRYRPLPELYPTRQDQAA